MVARFRLSFGENIKDYAGAGPCNNSLWRREGKGIVAEAAERKVGAAGPV
jgi:hypothetical protein